MNVDLTRWNRAGLERFRYVDGNAVTFLEHLRKMEAEAFLGANGEQKWKALEVAFPADPNETVQAMHGRWIEQYHDHREDYAWEILRSLAPSRVNKAPEAKQTGNTSGAPRAMMRGAPSRVPSRKGARKSGKAR